MKITTVPNMTSEIYTPITPPPVWTPMTKALKDCKVGIASACGVHLKTQTPYKLAGDRTWRKVPSDVQPDELMITHGGYDHTEPRYQQYVAISEITGTCKRRLYQRFL